MESIGVVLIDIVCDLTLPRLLLASETIAFTPIIRALTTIISTTLKPPTLLTRRNSMHHVAIIASAISLFFMWVSDLPTRINKPLNKDPVFCTASANVACVPLITHIPFSHYGFYPLGLFRPTHKTFHMNNPHNLNGEKKARPGMQRSEHS